MRDPHGGNANGEERYLSPMYGRGEGDYRSSSAPPKVIDRNAQEAAMADGLMAAGVGPSYFDFLREVCLCSFCAMCALICSCSRLLCLLLARALEWARASIVMLVSLRAREAAWCFS